MYRRGVVEEVDGKTARARVKFPQQGGLVSGWLDVLCRSSLGDQDVALPRPGCQVAVLLDDDGVDGCVLGAVYSETDPPPSESATAWAIGWADGGRLEYDGTAHKLIVTMPSGGKVELCGSSSAVALATKVQEELQGIANEIANHTHQAGALVAPSGGGPCTGITGAPASTSYSPGDVGSAQVQSS